MNMGGKNNADNDIGIVDWIEIIIREAFKDKNVFIHAVSGD